MPFPSNVPVSIFLLSYLWSFRPTLSVHIWVARYHTRRLRLDWLQSRLEVRYPYALRLILHRLVLVQFHGYTRDHSHA